MKLVFLDTEVTGLRDIDRIFELYYLVYDTKTGIKKEYQTYCDPGIPITYSVQGLCRIDGNITEGQPLLASTSEYKYLQELFQDPKCCFVAYNIEFDYNILKKEKINIPKDVKTIDVFQLVKHFIDIPPYENSKLCTIAYMFELYKKLPDDKQGNFHDAEYDTLITIELFKYIKNKYNLNIQQMIEYTEQPAIIKYFPMGKHKGEEISKVIEKDFSYIEWYLNTDMAKDMKDLTYTICTIIDSMK